MRTEGTGIPAFTPVEGGRGAAAAAGGLWRTGELLAWLGGLVLMLSAFMGWYSIQGDLRGALSVIGWNTGTIGKLVFVVGLAALLLLGLRVFGVELPPSVPDGLVVAGLGLAGTILVLVRLIDIPERLEPAGRGIGIWISLLASLVLIVAGLLKSAEDA
ncbi:MAG TPA: hypothetical protein VD704_13515 [Gaiellaceae bacterium]|nr:hypothetical protein [Gaiellaceae bacterium]